MSPKKRPPEFGPAPPENMAVDFDGTPLALSPEEVRRKAWELFEAGHLVAIVVEHNDELSVQVFGPPSKALLNVLEQTVAAYKVVLRGH
jgi:hypothetical protein